MGRLLSASVLLVLTACGAQEKSSEFIPDVPVECTAAQVAGCSGNNLPVFAGLISTLPADCDDYLTGMNATQRRSAFLASSTTTSARSGIYLTATLSDWLNDVGGTIDVLEPGDYTICAFVDLNSNDVLDTNEPVAQGTVPAGGTGFVLNQWTAAYN